MRKKIKGVEHIILSADGYGGYTSIEAEDLTKKMKDIFPNTDFTDLANELGLPVTAVEQRTLISIIKMDIAKNNRLGWKQHQKTLKEDGFDV